MQTSITRRPGGRRVPAREAGGFQALSALSLALAVFLAPAAGVADASLPLLTAEEAVALALRNNFELALVREETAQARLDRLTGLGPFLPSVSASADHTGWFDGEPSPRTTVGVSANLELFSGFRSAYAYKRLGLRETGAEIRERGAVESTVEAVLAAYYEVALQQERLAALRETLAVSQERARLAEARRGVGAGSQLELLQALADRNADSSAVLEQELALRAARIALNNLLARDAEAAFVVHDSIPVEDAPPVAAWRAALTERNAAIAAARQDLLAAEASVKEARGARLPTLTGSVGYSEAPEAINAGSTASSGSATYGLRLTLPLFDALRTRQATGTAAINLRRSEIALRRAEQEAVAAFADAAARHAAGVQRMSLEERNLEVARLQAEAAQERYRTGAAAPLEFRDAQQRLLAARVRLATARQSALRAGIALRRLSGTLAAPFAEETSR